jgi:hypothetical protein
MTVVAEADGRVRLPPAAGLLAADRGADLPGGFARTAPDVTRDLIRFALGPHLPVARRAAGNFLRHTFDLLSDPFHFLFGCLPAERRHALTSLKSLVKQEVFRFVTFTRLTGNASAPRRRLSSKET